MQPTRQSADEPAEQSKDKILPGRSYADYSSPRRGLRANVLWRAIDVEDLRLHPLYYSLPLPEEVFARQPCEFVLFRQGTWQWDALHSGRLTTSRAAACLGLYEPAASRKLSIPRSLCGHSKALHAWQHLTSPAPSSFDFINSEFSGVLSVKEEPVRIGDRDPSSIVGSARHSGTTTEDTKIWYRVSKAKQASGHGKYLYHYRPPRRFSMQQLRKQSYSSSTSARMAWGSTQEATAVLTALNYFSTQPRNSSLSLGDRDNKLSHNNSNSSNNARHQNSTSHREGIIGTSGTRVCEVGMCALEAVSVPMPLRPLLSSQLKQWLADGSLPLVGASPDGLLKHADGTCEVLEVKNHSPFMESRNKPYGSSQRGNSTSSNNNNSRPATENKSALSPELYINDRGPSQSIPVWHVPQSQLHILCAGPSCTGAVLVSLSATKGGTIFRMKRNDEVSLLLPSFVSIRSCVYLCAAQ